MSDRLPALDLELPPKGVWSSWTPVILDGPTDRVDLMRATGRFIARAARVSEDLQNAIAGESSQCERARSALRDLKSQSPCDALLDYWSCEASAVELPPGTAERYTSYSQELVDELMERCDLFAESNHIFDCSGVPCILLVDIAPGKEAEDMFCGRRFGSFVTSQAMPELITVWMYRGVDQPVFDRFHDEKQVRFEIARALLEAQR